MSSNIDRKALKNNDNIRIIKRNLVYVIGLDPKISNKETLVKKEFLGQYGKITKMLVNSGKAYTSNSNQGPSYSAYITYSTEQEAALAILSIDSSNYNGKQIKAAFGTTKYCAFYLKKVTCPNKECVYIHSVQDKSNIISKESADFYIEQHKIAIKVSGISTSSMWNILYTNRLDETVFPNPYSVYFKKNIICQLKADGVYDKLFPSSYRNNYHNRNLLDSDDKSYNKSNPKNKLGNYYDNSGEEVQITKTVIKEIYYDNVEEDPVPNETSTQKNNNCYNTPQKLVDEEPANLRESMRDLNEFNNFSDNEKSASKSRKQSSHMSSKSFNKASNQDRTSQLSQLSTRVYSNPQVDEKKIFSSSLFKLNSKSKFNFVVSNDLEKSEEDKDAEAENSIRQSMFLQQYFIRLPFSNLVKIPEKSNIEETYFSKLRTNLTN